jgi:hypothetical protein
MYRTIDTATWDDPWFAELQPDAKLLFLYFITNRRTTACGAFQITERAMLFETGFDSTRLHTSLKAITAKVSWWSEHQTIWVRNFYRHQRANSNERFTISARRALVAFAPAVVDTVCNAYPELSNNEGIPSQSHPNPITVSSQSDGYKETEQNRSVIDPPFIPPAGDETERRLNAVPKEQSAAAPKTSRKRSTATPLPDDFTVTEAMAEWATEQGLSTAEIRKQTEKFKSGALAHGRSYSDWAQAWRNWILNIDTYEPQRNGAHSNGANGSSAGGYIGQTIPSVAETKAYADEIRAIRAEKAAKQAARAGHSPPAAS